MDGKQRVAMVSGAAGNLGKAVAARFAASGARVALLGRTRESLSGVFGEEGAQRLFLAADLLDRQQVAAAVATTVERFGRIDVLCNLAGGFRMGEPVHETADSTWDFLMDINVRSMLNMVRAVVPRMLTAGGGKIVNVGAHSALKGVGQMGAYTAAKSVVMRLTEAMAAELRDRNINVNCVLPSIIDTPENRAAMPKADPSRWVSPADLATVIDFLASDAARAVHGAMLPVTGLS